MSERQRSWEINADQIRLALANNEQQRAVEIFVRLHPGDQVEVYDLLEIPEYPPACWWDEWEVEG